ncbi:MAG: esterase-like activity of phytase family protein [Cyanobacteria bacterium J06592_8]
MNIQNEIIPTSPLAQVRGGQWQRFFQAVASIILVLTLLSSCSLPQVSAEDRMFLNFSLDFLGEYTLPQTAESGLNVHLSSITYEIPGYGDRSTPGFHFYALADQNEDNLAQFYRLKFDLTSNENQTQLNAVKIENKIDLRDPSGQPISLTETYPESMTFSPRNSVFIAAEKIEGEDNVPLLGEFDLETGELRNTVPLPPGYRPMIEEGEQQQGIQANLGFKSMSIAPDGFSPGGKDPFRLFTSTATSLVQDQDINVDTKLRILHYVIADRASFLVSENLYPLEASETSPYQLADIVVLPQGGYFLSLERSPNSAQIYQVFTGDATDTSRIVSLRGDLRKVQAMRKRLLLDLNTLNIPVNSLASMTLGPRLPDGGQSLLLLSEENGAPEFLLFSLKQG